MVIPPSRLSNPPPADTIGCERDVCVFTPAGLWSPESPKSFFLTLFEISFNLNQHKEDARNRKDESVRIEAGKSYIIAVAGGDVRPG